MCPEHGTGLLFLFSLFDCAYAMDMQSNLVIFLSISFAFHRVSNFTFSDL